MGLDPGTPGSRPEPKADAQVSHPGVPILDNLSEPDSVSEDCKRRAVVSRKRNTACGLQLQFILEGFCLLVLMAYP